MAPLAADGVGVGVNTARAGVGLGLRDAVAAGCEGCGLVVEVGKGLAATAALTVAGGAGFAGDGAAGCPLELHPTSNTRLTRLADIESADRCRTFIARGSGRLGWANF
jgi:hypothetical protein